MGCLRRRPAPQLDPNLVVWQKQFAILGAVDQPAFRQGLRISMDTLRIASNAYSLSGLREKRVEA